MYRLLPALLVAAPLLAAPALKDRVTYYHPIAVGDKRVYELRTGGKVTESANEVLRVERKDGRLLVAVGRAGDTGFVLVEVSEQGLVEQLVIDTPTPRIPVLKLPAKAGNSWVYDPGNPEHWKTEYTIAAEADSVEVPAGRFTAVKVRTNQTLGGKSVRSAYWYAPRVGLVKMAREGGGEVFEYVLKSFTPGK